MRAWGQAMGPGPGDRAWGQALGKGTTERGARPWGQARSEGAGRTARWQEPISLGHSLTHTPLPLPGPPPHPPTHTHREVAGSHDGREDVVIVAVLLHPHVAVGVVRHAHPALPTTAQRAVGIVYVSRGGGRQMSEKVSHGIAAVKAFADLSHLPRVHGGLNGS